MFLTHLAYDELCRLGFPCSALPADDAHLVALGLHERVVSARGYLEDVRSEPAHVRTGVSGRPFLVVGGQRAEGVDCNQYVPHVRIHETLPVALLEAVEQGSLVEFGQPRQVVRLDGAPRLCSRSHHLLQQRLTADTKCVVVSYYNHTSHIVVIYRRILRN